VTAKNDALLDAMARRAAWRRAKRQGQTAVYGPPGCSVCGRPARHVVAGTYDSYCSEECEEKAR
jgi:hypothetical protein